MKKRVLSAWLVLCMLLTLLPTAVWAAEREEIPLGEEAVAAPVAEKAPAAPARAPAPATLAEVHSHDGFTAWSTTDAMPTDAGSYYLDNNVTLNLGYWSAPGDTNLCLNGNTLGTNINVFDGYKLTVSDCQGTGQITSDGQAICLYGDSELVLESGTIVSTANPDDYPPSQAIYNAGFVTLKGGTVTGPYGVGMYYSEGDYTDPSRSPITLEGAPTLNGAVADISITYDAANAYPLIDATAYTGDGVSIAIQANDDVALEGTPLVKLGSTPASKFTLDNAEGYSLEEKEVDGANCLVVKDPPPVIRLSWEEDSQPKTVNLAQKDLSSMSSYLNQMPNAGQGTMTLLTDLVTDLYVYNNLALTLTSGEEGPHTLTRPRVNRSGNPLTYGTTLLEIPEGSSVTVTNLTLDGTYPGTDDSHTPPPAAVELDGSLTLGKDAKLVNCGQPPAAEVAVTPNDAGGVYLGESSAALRMESGSAIQNGQGTTVGGVMMYDGTLTMTGGSITGNKGVGSWAEAGGVCLRGGTLTLSGDVVIKDNLVAADADDPGTPANVVLFEYSGPIQVVDALTGGANSIGITALYAPSVGSPVKVAKGAAATEGGQAYELTEADLAAFFADQSGYFLTLNEEENAIYLNAAAITTQPTVDAPTVAVNYAPQGIGYQWYTTKEVAKTVVGHVTGDSDTTVEAASQPGEYNERNQQWSAYRGEYFVIALKGGDKLTVTFPNGDMPTSGGLYLTEVDGRGNSWTHFFGAHSSDRFTVTDTAITCAIPAGVDGIFTLSISGLSNNATPPDILATRTRLGPDQAVDGQTTATLNTTAGGTYLCQVTWPGGFQLNSDVVTIPHVHDMSVDCGSGDPITFAKVLTCNQDGILCVDGTALETNNLSVDLPAGNYYLAQDVTLAHRMNIQGVVNLCLNGHEINLTESNQVQSIFNVKVGGTLNLCDCNGSQGSHSFTSPVTNETVTVQGGLVTGGWKGISASRYGSAAYVGDGGAMNLYGGAIAGNGSANNSRGAIYVAEGGTFQMYGGTLCHNTSASGGGICIDGAASILGGEIAHNNAIGSSICEGGGLLLGNTGSLTLGGGAVIRDNTAQAEIGGIGTYAFDGKAPTLIFTGAPTVTGNTGGGKPSNLYLDDGVVADATGMTGGRIGVTTQTAPTAGSPVSITTANSADLSGYFVSDKEDQAIKNGENNVVQLAAKPAHTHAVCGDTCGHEGADAHEAVSYTALTQDVVDGYEVQEHSSSILGESYEYIIIPAGRYYLEENITTDKMVKLGGNVDLCFNGHTFTSTFGNTSLRRGALMLSDNAVFNACDCQDGGGFTSDGEFGLVTDYANGGKNCAVNLYGGIFTGRSLISLGSTTNGTLTLDGATLNATDTALSTNGKVTIKSGSITSSGSYTVNVGAGDLTVTGGTIRNTDGYYAALRVVSPKPVKLSGSPVIQGGSQGDICLLYSTCKLEVGGLTGTYRVAAGSTVSEDAPWTITTPADADQSGHFTSATSGVGVRDFVGEDGKHTVQLCKAHTHAMSVGCETEGEDQVTFTPWSDATKLPTTAGHYYLTTDVAVSDMDAVTFRCDYWIVPDGVVDLCLNGHTITRASDGTLSSDPTIYFTHTKDSTLNLCDCSEDGTGAILAGDGSKSTTIENRHGTLRLYGGTVQGGLFGVSVTDGSAFEMHGGTVTGTHTYTEAGGTFGAGVYVGPSDTFRMTGGTITGNDRGMQVMNGGTFLVEGNPVIAGNETANVWLEGKASDPTVVYLTGALGETAKLSLNAEDWSLVEEHSSLVAVRGQDYPITEADFAKLSSYDPDYPLQLADGVVSFVIGPRHTHAVSVGCERDRGEQVTFTRLSAKDGALYIGTQKLEPNLDGQYPLPGGNYYLTEDIELGYPIVVPGNRFGGSVSLCLNGHQLKYAGAGERHTVISTPWELNICDCNGSQGHHTVTDPTTNESADIVGGLITGGTSGGVIVNRIAGGENTFNLYGGAIAGNQGSWGGGVTLSDNTKMVLYGGQVSYNTWRLDSRYTGFGGICAINATENVSASVEITGEGKVAHNLGGGVRIESHGTVTLSGSAAVADNQGIGNWPSGICLDQNSTLAMSGNASVTGNHITTDFYLSAPTCGGVYAPSGGVTLSGGAKIWDNKIDQPGGMTAAADLVLGSEFDTQGGDALVTVGGPLTADAKIGVSLLTPGQRVFTTGGGGDYADRFTSQQRGRFVEAQEGELSLTPYAILQQPTQANQCTVTVNGAPTSYKWYPAKQAEVTGANATAYTTQQGESSSCDGQGVWTGVKDPYDRYFFTIQLSRGDMLVVKPSQDLGYMPSVQIVSQDQDHVATGSNTPGQDGAYRITVPRDGTYDLSLSSQVDDLTLTATWLALGAEVEGQTAKQFTGEPGSYLCKIRYADGTTLTTDIVTRSGSSPTPTPTATPSAKPSTEPSAEPSTEPSARPSAEPSAKPTPTPTPGKTDQAAPAGLFTVTDIPVGGTSGSIAVTKDAGKLEWRPVTTPATEAWTPVTQSGDTAALTGLAAGSYEFRYKETATHNASPATTVQVRALSPDAKTLTIAGDIEHGTVTKRRDMVNPGDTVTLAVQPDAGYQLETITVRYTEGGMEKTVTPTVNPDNPAQYTFTMPDAAVSVTATFVPIPDQGNAKGEVDIKPDTPAVSVDKETLKDLAGEVPEGQSVTVKLTVEKQETPADKAELESVIQGSKDDVLYLDLSLFKQVNDQEPQAITDTGSKVLEIQVPYDFTGKQNVTVYRKHGDSAAEKLAKLTARPTQGFADGTFFADSKNGVVYIYASKFSTYAIGYTAKSSSLLRPRPNQSTSGQEEAPVWPFTDVTADDWFYGSVKAVYEGGLMEGTSDTTFAPTLSTTRASIATILWRLAGSPAAKGELPYPDCKADAWYAQAVIWATENGVVKGYGSGDFGPGDTITREQLAAMLHRYAQYARQDVSVGEDTNILSYPDFDQTGDWAIPALQWAVGSGIIKGKNGGILDPQGLVTRAEAAAMLERYLQIEH